MLMYSRSSCRVRMNPQEASSEVLTRRGHRSQGAASLRPSAPLDVKEHRMESFSQQQEVNGVGAQNNYNYRSDP